MNLREMTKKVEAVSLGFAHRHDVERTPEWFVHKLHEEVEELTRAISRQAERERADGAPTAVADCEFRGELADVLARVLLLGNHYGVDLQNALETKWLSWQSESV